MTSKKSTIKTKTDETVLEKEVETKSLKKMVQKGDTSELLAISKFTLIGIVLVVAALGIWIILMAIKHPDRADIALGVLAIAGLFFIGFLTVDILRWRDFTEWGTLGAIVSIIGFLFILVPLILNMLPVFNIFPELFAREKHLIFPNIGISLYEISIVLGGIIVIIGFTSHATELDQKVSDQFFIFVEWVKAGGIRQSLSALRQLIRTLMFGIAEYTVRGFRELGTRIKRFLRWIGRFFVTVFRIFLVFLTETFPRTIKRSLIIIWNNLHWIGLIAVIAFVIISPDLPTPDVIKLEILIIIGFFFFLGVIYPYRERITRIATNTSNFVLQKTISAYSMLSGSKLKPAEATFCSRCLRGVENREFESLKEIKGTMNPPCPFCGFNSWVGIEYKPTFIDKHTREEELVKTMIEGSDVGVRDVQKTITAEILPKVKEPKTTTKDSDVVTVSITDEKAMKKGKFPDYQSYQRAQDLGAQNYSELEYIDRLGAPDLETAEKIKNGRFAHYKTFQKALEVGASNVSELRLVEELKTPDLETAIKIQKSSFPDYPSYKRAHDLGASNYSELKFVDRLQAPDYETATKINRGKFPDYSSYRRAQDLGALNYSELKDLDRFQAPDVETVKKIRKGRFPDFPAFQKAQKVGISSFYEYQLVKELQAPNYETAKKMKQGNFPDYPSYKRAQDLGASNYSELEEVDHLQAPDFETVKNIRKGGFPDFQTFQKALEAGASSFSEYMSLETPESAVPKTVNEVPLPQEFIVNEEMVLKLLNELKFLVVDCLSILEAKEPYECYKLLMERIEQYQKSKIDLITLENMLRLSKESLLEINIDKMQTDEVRDYEEIHTLLHALLKTLNPQREKPLPEEERRKERKLISRRDGPELADQEGKPAKPESVLKEAKLDQEELEIITELKTLQDSPLFGRIDYLLKVLEKRPALSPKTINIVMCFRNHQDAGIRARVERILAEKNITKTTQKVVRREAPPLVSEINIFEFRKKVSELGQRIDPIEWNIQWQDWFLRQTHLYQRAQMTEAKYKTMLKRIQNHYLQRKKTNKMHLNEKQALDEMRTLIDAILAGQTKLITDKPLKTQISTQMQVKDDVTGECPSCGGKIYPKTSQFCSYCGAKLTFNSG